MADEPYCTHCGHILGPENRRESEMRWMCPSCPTSTGCGMTDHEAAFYRVGPFAPKRRPQWERRDIPGFVQIGQNSYERIAEPDAKVEYAKAMRETVNGIRSGKIPW